jgi:hypothetical protein
MKLREILLLTALPYAATAAVSLSIFPPHPVLYGPGARQRILLTSTEPGGLATDVTAGAHLSVADPRIAEFGADGILRALTTGTTRIEAVYESRRVSATLEVLQAAGPRELSFVKDIVPIFTKFGCAGSNCHGSIRGKAGFKLSLFGYEPNLDYQAIVQAADGRRIDRNKPEDSLILKKPTFQVPHGGGVRFEKNSLPYTALLEWVRSGARYDSAGSPTLKELSVYPPEAWFAGVNGAQQLIVTARYSDNTTEDVTDKVQFSSNDEAVVGVTKSGLLKPASSGEATIMVRTLGQAIAARVFVIKELAGKDYPEIRGENYVDQFVFDKLKRLNIVPSPLSEDAHFVRRVFLDVAGVLPTIEETRAFLQSRDPGKRSELIDRLLDRPERADFWATYFGDLFRLGFNESRDKGAKIFYDWIRQAILEDRPYNRIVSELLVSQGNLYYDPAANFYFVSRKLDPGDVATHVSQAFLGVRLECARCHNHPFEKWTQDDFYGFAAFFSRLDTKFVHAGSESNVYLKDEGVVIHPKTKEPVSPAYLEGPTTHEAPGADIRQELAKWVTSPRNPFFARTLANRVWRRYFGRGIVEPVDDFRITNPPSDAKLLQALADDFVAHGYSIKSLERTILNSRAYQLSSLPNDSNRQDRINCSHYYLKHMSAEQIMDAVLQATGTQERFAGWGPGTRAMQIPHGAPSYLLSVFGRVADREFAQERKEDPSLTQVLHLVNGDTIAKRLAVPGSRLAQWLDQPDLDDNAVLDRLFLATVARYPRKEERGAAFNASAGRTAAQRRSMFEDVFWALLNSKEFLYVH